MRRLLAVACVAPALAAIACTIAYSGYDSRFGSGDAGLEPFVRDDAAIQALAVTSSDLFYATSGAIKRVPLDGGPPSVWWSGNAASLVGDGAHTLAWSSTADEQVHEADVSSPDAAVVVSTTKLGQFGKLGADPSHLSWETVPAGSCPCELGQVSAWNVGGVRSLVYEGGVQAVAQDVAVDQQGVTFFVPSVGVRRYAFDGGLQCSHAAGVDSLGAPGALHAIAAGPQGSPFFAIGSNNGLPTGPLVRYATACDDAGTTVDPSAGSVMADETSVLWIASGGALDIEPLDGGAARNVPLSGTVAAMTSNASSVFVAIGTQIFRIAKD